MSRLPRTAAILGIASLLAVPALAQAPNPGGPEHKDQPGAHAPPHHAPAQHAQPQHAQPQHVQRDVTVHRNVEVNRHVTVHRNVTTVQHGPAGPRWARGARFGGQRRVFTDYDRYHVRRPPPGYEWVQDDNELVLIAIGTGIITDTFLINLN